MAINSYYLSLAPTYGAVILQSNRVFHSLFISFEISTSNSPAHKAIESQHCCATVRMQNEKGTDVEQKQRRPLRANQFAQYPNFQLKSLSTFCFVLRRFYRSSFCLTKMSDLAKRQLIAKKYWTD